MAEILLAHGGGDAHQFSKGPENPVFEIQKQGENNQYREHHTDDLDKVQQIDSGFGALLQHGDQSIYFSGVFLHRRDHLGG